MSPSQKTYRVYCYDEVHKFLNAELIEAIGDKEAVATAQALGFGSKCEVWEGERLVAKLGDERTAA